MFLARAVNRFTRLQVLCRALVALAAVLFASYTAHAGQVTLNSTPYSTLMTPGNYAIVGGLEFSNFQFFNPASGGTGTAPDPTQIYVSPGSIGSNSGLYFVTPSMNVLNTGFMDFHISFDVTALDPSTDLTQGELQINAATTGDGLSRIVENIDTSSSTQLGQLTAIESLSLPGGGQFFDSASFAAQSLIHIDKDVEVTSTLPVGGPLINSAGIGNFTQAFGLQGTAVPEPSSFALMGIGVGSLGWYGWRRRRPATARRRVAVA